MGEVTEVPADSIQPSPYQPRTIFRMDKLQELALSVKKHGIRLPLLVRPVSGINPEGVWELVAGERRLRAAKLAGLRLVPVIVKEMPDEEAEHVCLMENLDRENLEPIEEARAYGRLQDRGMTPHQIAAKMNKDPKRVAFYLLLINLKPEYQRYVEQGVLPLPQAADMGRLSHEQQRVALRWLTSGLHHTEFTRRVTALVEKDTQTSLVPDDSEAARVQDTLRHTLERVMRELGRCTDKKTLQLVGWVTGGDVQANLQRAELARRSLHHLIDALKKAAARQAVRESA